MRTLYPFQEVAFNDCKSFLFTDKQKDSGIAILPTGAGKSVIIAHLSKFASEKEPLLFIVPSIDLLRQNAKAIEDEGGEVGIYCGSINERNIKAITVATIMSLKNDMQAFKSAGIKKLIVDECHFKASEDGVFKEFLDFLKPTKLLGLTATAFKLKTYKGFPVLRFLSVIRPTLFKRVIHITQVSTLVENKRWSKIKYIHYPYNTHKLKLNSSGTEYTQESVEEVNREQMINRNICKQIRKIEQENPKAKILLFTDCVETAEIINEWINNTLTIKSGIVTATTSQKDRKDIVAEFKDINSNISVLINYGTFTTGFDFPELTHVIMGRATMSFALYYQIVGRLVRTHKDKAFGTFIDFCGNYNKFLGIENITYHYVEGYGWGVFVGDRLMTGIPLNSSVVYTIDAIKSLPLFNAVDKTLIITFGKHKGTPLYKLPFHYREFLINDFEWTLNDKNKEIIDQLLLLRENDVLRLVNYPPTP